MGIAFHWPPRKWKKVSIEEILCWNDYFAGISFQASEGFRGFAKFLHRIPQNLSDTNMFPPPPENGRKFPWKNDFAGRMICLEEVPMEETSLEEVTMEGSSHGRKSPKRR